MRQLSNWVDSFVEGTAHLPSPELFRKWAGIACIAGVLERKVWVKTMHSKLFPNLYTILVGPPGVGKSVVLRQTEALWRSLEGLHVAPKSVSKASIMDSLGDAKRSKSVVTAGSSIFLNFNSLLVNAGELGVFIPQYDPEFMNALTDVYDGDLYEERKRTKDLNLLIKEPCLNIIGGTTPSYLNQVLPEGAWDQGFLSRTFLIFCGTTNIVDLFGGMSEEELTEAPLIPKLRSDLRAIFDLIGTFSFSPEAQRAISTWHLSGGPPKPDHPKLVNYCTRRSAHLLKLCMIACAARGDDKIIGLYDYQTALGWLLEAEVAMEEIFKALGAKGDGQTISEAIHYIYKLQMANGDPVQEQRLVAFLAAKVPAYNVTKLIELMEKSGQINKQLRKDGGFGYLINPKAFDY